MKKLYLPLLALLVIISGCTTQHHTRTDAFRDDSDIIIVKVTGYGAPKNTFANAAQRRLMTMRASEIDAYRKVAEQVAGIYITGDSDLNDYMAGNDRLRTQLNTYIQGAAITHQEILDDGVAVTQMSMQVSRSQLIRMLEKENTNPVRRGAGLVPGGAVRDPGYTF
ncbi:MAG: LPP20 family lipoprotein [Nitrincola lacisaponensis]|uniref:Lipoprotein n=1 Tax=Nitrincola lacisaponensis TaxID=267850 RepID=A0A063Y6X0_9GAMM|nr:hypothetical protein [Nitrincola lacisaponensis]KDE40476.1 hypothetical protein ADINL_1068 [Nitrincola lacisaponensis]